MVVSLRGGRAACITCQAQACFQSYTVLSTNFVVIAQTPNIRQGKGHNSASRTKGKRQDCFSGTLLNLWQFIDTRFLCNSEMP